MYFSDLQRPNGFHALRFLAATLVLIDHAWPLTGRLPTSLPLCGDSLGGMAVGVFFTISGFLVADSRARSSSVASFLHKRALRVMPGFLFVVLASVFVLGPLLTRLPLDDYFRHELTRRYFANLTLFDVQLALPGVFEHNVYPYAVNGSTWTLPIEVAMYVLLAIAAPVWMTRLGSLALLLAGFGVYVAYAGTWSASATLFWVTLPARLTLQNALFFGAGVAAFQWRHALRLKPWFAVFLWGVAVMTSDAAFAKVCWVLAIAYTVLLLATLPALSRFSGPHDYSYGIYLFAFPVQQTIVSVLGVELPMAVNLVLCFALTLGLAAISWHLVEKPALQLKSGLARARDRVPSSVSVAGTSVV